MNQIEGLVLLVALPACMLLNGYWLAALLETVDVAERIAFALVAGLAMLLAAVATVNFFQPLSGPWAFACLIPLGLTVALPRTRRQLRLDLVAWWRAAPNGVLVAGIGFFVLLLWPVLVDPAALFYDGTSNHDSFFWIAGAEYLKRHTYMEAPVLLAVQPLSSPAVAFVGWNPPWGRMGGEGLLALASGVVGLSPLKLYLYGSASLALPWMAISLLTVRTFVAPALSRLALVGLVAAQPVFVFFQGNANLPNLLGTLCGSSAIVALERAIRAGRGSGPEFTAWSALLALSLHGLLCSYPEMIPFVLLPCALLWLRPWFAAGPRRYWRTALALIVIGLAGLALNPATSIRAYHGFMASFASARADASWANLFAPLEAAEYIPALVSLSISGAKELDGWLGWPLSGLLVGTVFLILRRCSDPYGLVAGLSGAAVLLAYTLVTDFAYGWQKTVQFAGVFVAAMFPVAAIHWLDRLRMESPKWRRLTVVALVGVAGFMSYTTVMNCRDLYKWSDRKVISSDWFQLRDYSRARLNHVPVLIEAATFRMAFFHGMWATYFLPESNLYFGARGEESGGYLRGAIVNEATQAIPAPAAILVGRPWADTFDANSPRLVGGREFALLAKSNRVTSMSGVNPGNGPPDNITGAATFQIIPHSDSVLRLEIRPRAKAGWPAGEWRVTRRADGVADFEGAVSGASPWRIEIPLLGGRANTVEIRLAGSAAAPEQLSFAISGLRVENAPR